jgi:predicted nucleic acid-binding protein
MPEFVLDSWAIMAWLKDEKPAADRVLALLDAVERRAYRVVMNIVNVGEVFYLSAKAKDLAYAERILENLRARIATVPASDELVMLAATLKARHAISYADAFAVATAIMQDIPLVTGDPELKAMSSKEQTLKLEWIAS